jgi:predicted nucleic acid-binding protein
MASEQTLDTNILLYYVLPDVSGKREQVLDLINKQGTVYYAPDLAIYEMVYVLEKVQGFTRAQVHQAVQAIMMHGSIRCNDGLLEGVLSLYETHPKLSFADCYLASEAQSHKRVPLWTADKKLANQCECAELAV